MAIPTPNFHAGRLLASAFNYTTTILSGSASGTNVTIVVASSPVVAASDGSPYTPFSTNAPVTLGVGLASAETVTPSAVSYTAVSGAVQLTVTTSNAHNFGETVTSGSGGLQEALNVANSSGGGVVTLDASFTGTAAQINSATGFGQVTIEDIRTGINARPSKVALAGTTDVIPVQEGVYVFTNASVDAATLAAPVAGIDDGKVLMFTTKTAAAHTVTVGANKINNAATGKLTWTAAIGNNATLVAYQGAYYTLSLSGVTVS